MENTYPTSFPKQKQNRHPGLEYEMKPQPIYTYDNLLLGENLLKNKVALITGGDSGIGKAIAVLFAKHGAQIAFVFLDEDQDAQNTQAIIESIGQKCLRFKGDISNEFFCQDVVSQIISAFGKIDILINNAAVQYECKNFNQITSSQFDKTFKINVYGTFYITKAVLPHLSAGCSIITTTSVVAYNGHETLIDYSMTKGALTSFTRSLSLALCQDNRGIRVNAVAPGPIWTPFIPSTFDETKTASFGNNTPMIRAGQPVECAGAYLFLASDLATYITGQTIHINGGEFVSS